MAKPPLESPERRRTQRFGEGTSCMLGGDVGGRAEIGWMVFFARRSWCGLYTLFFSKVTPVATIRVKHSVLCRNESACFAHNSRYTLDWDARPRNPSSYRVLAASFQGRSYVRGREVPGNRLCFVICSFESPCVPKLGISNPGRCDEPRRPKDFWQDIKLPSRP